MDQSQKQNGYNLKPQNSKRDPVVEVKPKYKGKETTAADFKK